MKRILMCVLCVFLVLGCVACSPSTPDQGQEPGDLNQPEQPEQPGTTNENEDGGMPGENDQNEYDSDIRVGFKKIYMNYKQTRPVQGGASSYVFKGDATNLPVLAYDDSNQFSGTPTEALALINDGRIFQDISRFVVANFREANQKYLIDVKTTENVKVGELDMLRFTGSVTSSDNRVCYVYGYAFVMDNTPCVLAGLVLTAEQEASLIESITAEVEAMIKTVRSER